MRSDKVELAQSALSENCPAPPTQRARGGHAGRAAGLAPPPLVQPSSGQNTLRRLVKGWRRTSRGSAPARSAAGAARGALGIPVLKLFDVSLAVAAHPL